MFTTGISTKAVKENSKQAEKDLCTNLQSRFFQDLSHNMIFYCFNVLNSQGFIMEKGEKKTLAEHFTKAWLDGTKKQISSEIQEMNSGFFMSRSSRIMQAICGYSLPTTEDINVTYLNAIGKVLKDFENGIKGSRPKDFGKNIEEWEEEEEDSDED